MPGPEGWSPARDLKPDNIGIQEYGKKAGLRETFNSLDPVRLLRDIRTIQHRLTTLEVSNSNAQVAAPERNLDRFVESLSNAWKAGEVRPNPPKTDNRPASVAHSPRSVRKHVGACRAMAQRSARRQRQGTAPASSAGRSNDSRTTCCEPSSGESENGAPQSLDA